MSPKKHEVETDVRADCATMIEEEFGGRSYPWSSPGNNFVMDRIVFIPKLPVIFIEYKTKKGRESKGQAATRKELQALGRYVLVIDDVDSLRDTIKIMLVAYE